MNKETAEIENIKVWHCSSESVKRVLGKIELLTHKGICSKNPEYLENVLKEIREYCQEQKKLIK